MESNTGMVSLSISIPSCGADIFRLLPRLLLERSCAAVCAVSGELHVLRENPTEIVQPPEAVDEAKAPQEGEPSDEELDHNAERDLKACLRHGPEVRVSVPSSHLSWS